MTARHLKHAPRSNPLDARFPDTMRSNDIILRVYNARGESVAAGERIWQDELRKMEREFNDLKSRCVDYLRRRPRKNRTNTTRE